MATVDENEVSSFEQFIEACSEAYRQTQRELKEIDLLVQQTTGEVERLAQRNTKTTNQLRHVEAAIDTVPRQDMQDAYTAVLDTQQRLFTMRGQLEKLESDQRNLGRYLTLLRGILEHTDRPEGYAPEMPEAVQPTRPGVVHIIEAQERERRRLSRQMHDGPAQSLTNLILQAEICERLLDVDAEQARVELKNLRDSVAGTFHELKGFILSLRPMMLDDLGLVPTLRRYLESTSETSDLQTKLDVLGKERRLAQYQEVTTFRIVQQLLENARELSNASRARILLDLEGDRLRVVFEDDGDGFEMGDALAEQDPKGLGWVTMRERVEMLGGEIRFESDVGRGTRVSFELPMSDQAAPVATA